MAKKTKRMWRWVSLDHGATMLDVWPGVSRPKLAADGAWECDGVNRYAAVVCADAFREVFGIDVKPGTCVKVSFAKATLIED